MKKRYNKSTDSMLVTFEAGARSRGSQYWNCCVSYTWSEYLQAYWVYSVQVASLHGADDRVTRETVMKTTREVDHLLDYLADLEVLLKKVYGE